MKGHLKKPPRETRAEVERRLDEAIDESFPASDPSAITPTSAGSPWHSSRKGASRKSRV